MNYYVGIESTFRGPPEKNSKARSRVYANCECRCGARFVAMLKDVKGGTTTSCGCRRKRTLSKLFKTHGESGFPTKELRTYYGIIKRCSNPKDKSWHLYGGRGILCKFSRFEDFLSCVGRAPSNAHSIDRIRVDGHYEPGNVRWATNSEQQSNKRNTVYLQVRGEVRSLTEWCTEFGVQKYTFYNKKKRGKAPEEIFKP